MRITSKGSFKNIERFLKRTKKLTPLDILNAYGKIGVQALQSSTPIDSGKTAASWDYNIEKTKKSYILSWTNSNVTNSGTPIAILIQYGHATNGGGYVEGFDFINPAVRPIFQAIADEIWKEVTQA